MQLQFQPTSTSHAVAVIKQDAVWSDMLPQVRAAFKSDEQLQTVSVRAKGGVHLMYERDDPAVGVL